MAVSAVAGHRQSIHRIHTPTASSNLCRRNAFRFGLAARQEYKDTTTSSADEAPAIDATTEAAALPIDVLASSRCDSTTIEYAGSKSLLLETGEIGRLANGSIMLTAGDTMIYTNACADYNILESDFTPLQIAYHERLSAAGRTAGGFIKRDGRPREIETLISRLVDRPLRPLFHKGWRRDTQILQWVLSYDADSCPQPHAITAAAAALLVSDIPFPHAVAGVRVVMRSDKFVINPTIEEGEGATLDLLVAGTKSAVLMIEGSAKFVPEAIVLDAIAAAHKAIAEICSQMQVWADKVGKPKQEVMPPPPEWLKARVETVDDGSMLEAYQIGKKQERGKEVAARRAAIQQALAQEAEDQNVSQLDVTSVIKTHEKGTLRALLCKGVRPDGRALDTVRPITSRASVLPRVHGSAMFTRGETQVLAMATLGDLASAQMGETLAKEKDESLQRFYLQYFFPPSSVGETGRIGGAGRREIGHGKLAEKALAPLIEELEDFPYVIRLESQDAGVPLQRRVAGVAMGLVLDDAAPGGAAILTDIMGLEDALGDMDFKVAGDSGSITALQMDIKVEGVTMDIMRSALEAARKGREHILAEMDACHPPPRQALSPYCPRLLQYKIPEDKVGQIIGPGGKNIKRLRERFDIDTAEMFADQGLLVVTCTEANLPQAQKLIDHVKESLRELQVGDVFKATKVAAVKDIGAIVELPGGKDALVHISELSMEPVESVAAAVKVGDEVDVMIVGLQGNSTRASVAAIERVAKGLPMLEKRTRRRPEGDSESRDGRGRGSRGGRGRGRDGRSAGRVYRRRDSYGSDESVASTSSSDPTLGVKSVVDSSSTTLSVESVADSSSATLGAESVADSSSSSAQPERPVVKSP